jgi:predicted molibdopterin-dependent oxidoreductase YjgC
MTASGGATDRRPGESRLAGEGGIERGDRLEFTFDGEAITAYAGESIAAALLANGHRHWRTTPRRVEPRGLYCGIGVCYECLVEIDGAPGRRACMIEVQGGMRVASQDLLVSEAGVVGRTERDP